MRSLALATIGCLAAAGSLLLQGCAGLGCNDIGAFSGLVFHLDLPEGVQPTSATVRLVVEGRTYEYACGSGDFARSSSCGLGKSSVSVDMNVSSEPSPLDLRLTLDEGAFVFEGTVRPSYETDEPWGEGCGFNTVGTATVAPVPVP